MPRGVKRVQKSIADQIIDVDNQIAGFQDKINDFKSKIKELETQKKALLEAENQEKLQQILEVASEKGLSVDDIIKKISK